MTFDRDKAKQVLHQYLAGVPTRIVLDELEACIVTDDEQVHA